MKYNDLLDIVRNEPVFESGLLMTGDVDAKDIRRQLSRWTASGKLIQLRKGLYTTAPPYQKSRPHPFVIANRMVPGSYVSFESALGWYSLIPEYVPVTASACMSRPGRRKNAMGVFDYHHIGRKYHFGYHQVSLPDNQQAFVAWPEKALLDLIHLRKGGDRFAFIESLRLQNLEQIDMKRLEDFASRSGAPKWMRAVESIVHIVESESEAVTL